jgi:hypothetical protein
MRRSQALLVHAASAVAFSLLAGCGNNELTDVSLRSPELSYLDGKPLDPSRMVKLRSAEQGCALSVRREGVVRAITIRGAQMPVRLPAISVGTAGQHGNGRAVTTTIKTARMAEPLFVTCIVPDQMGVAELTSLLLQTNRWESLYMHVKQARPLSQEDQGRLESREIQQVLWERLSAHPRPMGLFTDTDGKGATRSLTSCGQGYATGPSTEGRANYSTAVSCVCYQSAGTWYCHVEANDLHWEVGGFSSGTSIEDGIVVDCTEGGCGAGGVDDYYETSPYGVPCTPNLFNFNTCRKDLSTANMTKVTNARGHVSLRTNNPSEYANLVCAAIWNRFNQILNSPTESKILKLGNAALPDGGAGPHAGLWDGTYIHLDADFFNSADNSGLIAAWMHETAHEMGYDHPSGQVNGVYVDGPFQFLSFSTSSNVPNSAGNACISDGP